MNLHDQWWEGGELPVNSAVDRINVRVDPERKRRLQFAADLSYQSLPAFVLSAADEKAARLVAEQRTTMLPAEFFDEFFDSVAAEPTETTIDATRRLLEYVHRDG